MNKLFLLALSLVCIGSLQARYYEGDYHREVHRQGDNEVINDANGSSEVVGTDVATEDEGVYDPNYDRLYYDNKGDEYRSQILGRREYGT